MCVYDSIECFISALHVSELASDLQIRKKGILKEKDMIILSSESIMNLPFSDCLC